MCVCPLRDAISRFLIPISLSFPAVVQGTPRWTRMPPKTPTERSSWHIWRMKPLKGDLNESLSDSAASRRCGLGGMGSAGVGTSKTGHILHDLDELSFFSCITAANCDG